MELEVYEDKFMEAIWAQDHVVCALQVIIAPRITWKTRASAVYAGFTLVLDAVRAARLSADTHPTKTVKAVRVIPANHAVNASRASSPAVDVCFTKARQAVRAVREGVFHRIDAAARCENSRSPVN